MANTSIEKRLQTLQQKRDAIDTEIKQIQAAKNRELRKRQQRREALVGKVIYQLIEDEIPFSGGPWSEGDLLALIAKYVKKQGDRQLFGLEPLEPNNTQKSKSTKRAKNSSRKTAVSTRQQKAIENSKTGSKAKATKQVKPALPTGDSQDELMSEFNL